MVVSTKSGLCQETPQKWSHVATLRFQHVPKIHSSLESLERQAILGLALKGHAELEQFTHRVRKVLEEQLVVLGVEGDLFLEDRVLDEGYVRREHHQALGGLILVLLGPVPAAPAPFLLHQQAEVVIREDGWREGPGAVKAGAVGVAAA